MKYVPSDLTNKVVLSIGRMTEAKRQWIMIDLWDKIVNEHYIKDWQLHLVGNGNLYEQLSNKIQTLGLQEYVKYCHLYRMLKSIINPRQHLC